MYTLPPLTVFSRTPSSNTPPFDRISHEPPTGNAALQNLQRDNTSLTSAYSAAKQHITELENTVQASSAEFGKLIKERQSLKAKIDVLEAEVEELQSNMEQSQRQSEARDTQYSHIVQMSTKLQTQAVTDGQQRDHERHQWTREKAGMQQTITSLRSEVRMLRRSHGGFPPASTARGQAKGSELEDSGDLSPAGLEEEMRHLQHVNSSLEDSLEHVRKEHAQLIQHIEKLGGIGRNIQRHLRTPYEEQEEEEEEEDDEDDDDDDDDEPDDPQTSGSVECLRIVHDIREREI